jgi:hypothetical protein
MIEMEVQIICHESQGGWVKVHKLMEDGRVETTFHEGHTEEARLREEARQQDAHSEVTPVYFAYVCLPKPQCAEDRARPLFKPSARDAPRWPCPHHGLGLLVDVSAVRESSLATAHSMT